LPVLISAFWKSALANAAHRVNPFEASTFDGVLKAAVGNLDPTGAYEVLNDDVAPSAAGDKLNITNTWVVYARKRSTGIFLEDIKRLKSRNPQPDIFAFCLQIELQPRQPLKLMLISCEVFGRNGKCGFGFELFDLLDIGEQV
jgi:hypothetical protein